MEITFTIYGTPEGDNHALPKLKMTGRQHWTDKAQRYVAWKNFVEQEFQKAAKQKDLRDPREFKESTEHAIVALYPRAITGKKAITIQPGAYCHMAIFCNFKNKKHADPENIFGSIADALFHNDARLRGSFDFTEDAVKASVRVTINFGKPNW